MDFKKTGLIYDPLMLTHKSKRDHPEKPARIQHIMARLESQFYLSHPHVDYHPTIKRHATSSEIQLVHSKNYISYVENLWPKNSHRSDLTVLDTYANEHTEKIAKLALGGLLDGIDSVVKGQWKNGFAVIRPPGHHAGHRHTITGFCIFNNVAVGARYIQETHKLAKVAIVDWDVHHGDGTQHVFQENESILLISIHRHDRGSFYPAGDYGSLSSNGKGKGEGTKINIPLHHVDKNFKTYNLQGAGDNQYIYIYERIIEPILKEFNPDFILVSSGFDAARHDPLGGFSITPNGYYYMTKKLVQLNKPTLVVLEGGYNLNSISLAACAVMRGLLEQETLPEPVQNITYSNIASHCQIPSEYYDQIDEIIEFHAKKWPILKSQELQKYSNHIKKIKIRSFGIVDPDESSSSSSSQSDKEQNLKQIESLAIQTKPEEPNAKSNKKGTQFSSDESTTQFYFAAGHIQRFKNFSPLSPTLQKWSYPSEIAFYQSDFLETKYAPKYFGQKESYIVIENVLFEQKNHIVMDIKLSRQSKNPENSEEKIEKEKKKQNLSTSEKYAFRIGGYTTPDYKEGGILIGNEQTVKKLLEKVVDQTNKKLFCDFLFNLSNDLKLVRRKYYGTSIILMKGDVKSHIRWIDFHYWYDNCSTYDHDLVEGIDNLRLFISEIGPSESQPFQIIKNQ